MLFASFSDTDPSKLVLLMATPAYLACIGWEAWTLARARRSNYTKAETLNNVALAASFQVVELFALVVVLGIHARVYEHRLFTVPRTWWTFLILWVLQDGLYYAAHRASHRVRWLWASHVVHHSQEAMNFSTAFRQSLLSPFFGMWPFYLPLTWLGFAPTFVLLAVNVNLVYQFFVHTELVRKLGVLERVLNTPSHHRVHHARNSQYIDKNYAGTLIVWDKLFGTFEEERERPQYGIVHPLRTANPLITIFHEPVAMIRDALRPGRLADRLKHLWAPPGWERATSPKAHDPGPPPRDGLPRGRAPKAV
ncbi:sterol desaturase family protein [Pendulispora albinea]|uniref:Sterol desaturase family protein n=1 Tax=Pendulispora albinea TaxID=2741071 RepID=A0ABZ2M6X6_9BACT